jgi:hypothetical protein
MSSTHTCYVAFAVVLVGLVVAGVVCACNWEGYTSCELVRNQMEDAPLVSKGSATFGKGTFKMTPYTDSPYAGKCNPALQNASKCPDGYVFTNPAVLHENLYLGAMDLKKIQFDDQNLEEVLTNRGKIKRAFSNPGGGRPAGIFDAQSRMVEHQLRSTRATINAGVEEVNKYLDEHGNYGSCTVGDVSASMSKADGNPYAHVKPLIPIPPLRVSHQIEHKPYVFKKDSRGMSLPLQTEYKAYVFKKDMLGKPPWCGSIEKATEAPPNLC